MEFVETLGLAAGFLTTVAYVPQVVKIWRSKSAKDVSLRTFAALTLGIAAWLAYGILKHDVPLVLWNAVTLVLSGAILAMKVKYR
jgi:MtN3 and saliva related transmembrane protein